MGDNSVTQTVLLVALWVGWLTGCLVVVRVARAKRLHGLRWGLGSLVFSPLLALIALVAMPDGVVTDSADKAEYGIVAAAAVAIVVAVRLLLGAQ
jgi:hypothetical protein